MRQSKLPAASWVNAKITVEWEDCHVPEQEIPMIPDPPEPR